MTGPQSDRPDVPAPDLEQLARDAELKAAEVAAGAQSADAATAADNGAASASPPLGPPAPEPPAARSRTIDQQMVMAHDQRLEQLEAELIGLHRSEMFLLCAVALLALVTVVDRYRRRLDE